MAGDLMKTSLMQKLIFYVLILDARESRALVSNEYSFWNKCVVKLVTFACWCRKIRCKRRVVYDL